MRFAHLASALLFSSVIGGGIALAHADSSQVHDEPMIVAGIETVCTGVGLEARTDPKWSAYPLKLEFVGKFGQMLGGTKVTVSGNGHTVDVHCSGPWVLMKLPAGSYHMSADVADAGHKEMNIRVPSKLTIRYPNSGGEITKNKEQIAAR
ncbi:MAG: hypothetical protein EXR00_03675 [Alphaproteobacteria bacterium]|nr:hypothetical protein [Alphaproteobacteria bacterium]